MKINYIILGHKNPRQLKRLIQRLSEPWTSFFIHIDLNSEIEPFVQSISELKYNSNITYIKKREESLWGDIGLVNATINALKEITEITDINSSVRGYNILISGQDYPIRTNEAILNFLHLNYGTEFIALFPLPHKNWDYGGKNRLEKYKINKSKKNRHFLLLPSIFDRDFYSLETLGKLNFLRKTGKYNSIKKIFKKRSFPGYLMPYGGGQWWAFTFETTEKILKFIDDHPRYLSYHSDTLIPDEIFFQSIVANLIPAENLAPSITYVNWEKPSGPLPVTFSEKDIQELKVASKEKLFARKFDITTHSYVLDIIDSEILAKKKK